METNRAARSHADRGAIDPALIEAECISEAWAPDNIDFLVGSLGAVALIAALSREIAFLPGVMWLCSVILARWFTCLLAKNLARHRSGQRLGIQRRLIMVAMVEGVLWGSAPMVLHVSDSRYEVLRSARFWQSASCRPWPTRHTSQQRLRSRHHSTSCSPSGC